MDVSSILLCWHQKHSIKITLVMKCETSKLYFELNYLGREIWQDNGLLQIIEGHNLSKCIQKWSVGLQDCSHATERKSTIMGKETPSTINTSHGYELLAATIYDVSTSPQTTSPYFVVMSHYSSLSHWCILANFTPKFLIYHSHGWGIQTQALIWRERSGYAHWAALLLIRRER